MSEANGPGEPTVIVVTQGAEGEGGGEGSPTVEILGAGEGGESEAVRLAEIEGETAIALAVISGENELAIMEHLSDAHENTELEQCRLRIAELEGVTTAQATELQSLRTAAAAPLILTPLTPEPPPPPLPPSGEGAGPPESLVAPVVEPEEAPPPPEAPKPKRKGHLRLI